MLNNIIWPLKSSCEPTYKEQRQIFTKNKFMDGFASSRLFIDTHVPGGATPGAMSKQMQTSNNLSDDMHGLISYADELKQ